MFELLLSIVALVSAIVVVIRHIRLERTVRELERHYGLRK